MVNRINRKSQTSLSLRHMQNKTFYLLAILLAALTTVECHLMGSSMRGGEQLTPSIISLIAGLAIGIIAMFRVQKTQGSKPTTLIVSVVLGLFSLWLIADTAHFSKAIFSGTAVDYHISDVIPIMEIMAKRFLHGEEVYANIPEIWGGMLPIYLPSMWLPYIFSTLGHFDPRWIDVVFMLAATVVPMVLLRGDRKYSWGSLLAIPAVIALYQQFMHVDTRLVSMSDEGVVIGWYALLACALWRRKPVLIGLTIALSLLSRLSIIGWIPAFGLFVFLFDDKKKAFKIAGVAAAVSLVLMVVTKAIFNLSNFLDLPKRYLAAVQGDDYQKLKGAINEGMGIAKALDQQQLTTLHAVNQWSTFLLPLLLLALYARFKKYFDKDMYPIAMLKISLVVFFNLLIIPIHTMFYTSAFISVAILLFYVQSNAQTVPAGNQHTA